MIAREMKARAAIIVGKLRNSTQVGLPTLDVLHDGPTVLLCEPFRKPCPLM